MDLKKLYLTFLMVASTFALSTVVTHTSNGEEMETTAEESPTMDDGSTDGVEISGDDEASDDMSVDEGGEAEDATGDGAAMNVSATDDPTSEEAAEPEAPAEEPTAGGEEADEAPAAAAGPPEKCPDDKEVKAEDLVGAGDGGSAAGGSVEMNKVISSTAFKSGQQKEPYKLHTFTRGAPEKDSKGPYCKYTVTDSNGNNGTYFVRY